MRLTRHNGRAGKNGVYNPKHNDRRFDVNNSEHIDAERVSQNIYWDCIHGYRTINDQRDSDEALETFSEIERLFYEQRYAGIVEGQNARNAKTRHVERNRTAEQILQNKKTCPEETIYQIGTTDEHISEEILLAIVTDFMSEMDRRFGSNVHILDWALHMDESTPHIHERHVFDAENQYGEIAPQQEKALEALGFELPDPTKKSGKFNNRKIVFDATCRTMFFDIAEQHGLHLTEDSEYGGRKYLEKQDFILMQQKKKLAQGEVQLGVQQTLITENETRPEVQKSEITENADAPAEKRRICEADRRTETTNQQKTEHGALRHSMKYDIGCLYYFQKKGHSVLMPCALSLFSKEIAVCPGSGKRQNQKIMLNPVNQQPVRLYVALPVSDPVTC